MSKIKISKKSLFDEFEVHGYWWFPGSETKTPGKLIRKKNDTTLELYGTLLVQEQQIERNDSEPAQIIWGLTETNEKITIFPFDFSRGEINLPGVQLEIHYIFQFLVGTHVHNLNELELNSLHIDFTYMSTWLKMITFQSTPIFQDDESVSMQVQTKNPDNMSISLPSIDAVLENTGFFNLESDFYEKANISFTTIFKLTANTSQNFDWYRNKLFSMQKLLALLTGQSIFIKNVFFEGAEETVYVKEMEYQQKRKYKWFYDQNDEVEIKDKINPYDFTVQYPEIRQLFPYILNNWFEKEDKLDVVFDLYINELYKPMHLTSTFLNYIQAIEVYHRRSYDGKIIDEKDYNVFKEIMREFIENESPEELKAKLLGSLPYGNERTLNYRLKELARSLQPETKLFLFNSDKSVPAHLFQRIIDTRNYLTHYDPNNKNIIETEYRHHAIEILKAFVTIILFKELGMNEEFILNKLLTIRYLKESLDESNQVLII